MIEYTLIYILVKNQISRLVNGENGMKNYNVIVIQIIAQYVQNMEIVNFQNNKVGICKFTKEFNNGVYKLEFSNDEWSVKLDLKSLTFQNCSTYVNDFLIE